MKTIRFLVAMLLGLSIWGCGGGGSPSSGAANPLVAGRAALGQVSDGQQTASTQTLQSILALFQQALQQDPNSAEARFGIAVCLAGVVGQEVDGSASASVSSTGSGGNGDVPPAPPALPGSGTSGSSGSSSSSSGAAQGDVPPAPPSFVSPPAALPPTHTLGLFWNLSGTISNPLALLDLLAPVTDIRYGLLPFYGDAETAADVATRQQMLANLTTVEQDLQTLEANPTFTETLPVSGGASGQTVTVGLPEVYLFDAYVNSLSVQLALSLAYSRDAGNWQPVIGPVYSLYPTVGPPAAVTSQTGTSQNVTLTPSQYLPPSPYLTLRDASLLKTAQQGMLTVVDRETKGINGVLARPASGNFLINNTADVNQKLTTIQKSVIPVIGQAAVGPVTIQVPHYALPIDTIQATAGQGTTAAASVLAGGIFPQPAVVSQTTGATSTSPPSPPTLAAETVTVNLAAWFTTPPQDLKVFAPTITLIGGTIVDPAKSVYPDPTFGGLFPNGLPQDLRF